MRNNREHLRYWLGLPVRRYDPKLPVDYAGTIYRIAEGSDCLPIAEQLERFLTGPGAESAPALIIGNYPGSAKRIVQLLVQYRTQLPSLRGLYLGDITRQERLIAKIQLADLTPIFHAFPGLQHLLVRGTEGMSLKPVRHLSLKSLSIENPRLAPQHFASLAQSVFPELEQLELWLTKVGQRRSASFEDVIPLLSTGIFPRLKYLGLHEPEIDAFAPILRDHFTTETLEELDLSPVDHIGHRGAQALLACPALKKLKRLNLARYDYGLDSPWLEEDYEMLRKICPSVIMSMIPKLP